MKTLTAEKIDSYQAQTFHTKPEQRVQSKEQAVAFVNKRGFIFFWSIKEVTFPSLWTAVAGNRPVPNNHDDPGHVTWGWKDEMLGTRQWYYAKILRGKATMISLEDAPYFYALTENYGEPEKDYVQQYEDGLLSREGKIIYETLLREGPLDTVNLRRQINMTRRKSDSPFARAMTELQRDCKILPVGIANTGAWRYSFIYDAVHRHYPELPQQARAISRSEARAHLLRRAFASVGAADERQMRLLFQWRPRDLKQSLQKLVEEDALSALPGDSPGKGFYIWHELAG